MYYRSNPHELLLPCFQRKQVCLKKRRNAGGHQHNSQYEEEKEWANDGALWSPCIQWQFIKDVSENTNVLTQKTDISASGKHKHTVHVCAYVRTRHHTDACSANCNSRLTPCCRTWHCSNWTTDSLPRSNKVWNVLIVLTALHLDVSVLYTHCYPAHALHILPASV